MTEEDWREIERNWRDPITGLPHGAELPGGFGRVVMLRGFVIHEDKITSDQRRKKNPLLSPRRDG